MATLVTNRGMQMILSADVDLRDDAIKVMLLNSAFAPLATHNVASDISASELSVTGYVGGFAGSGRKSLANKTFTEDDVTGTSTFDADDLTWIAISSAGATHAAIIKEVTADTDSPVLGYIVFSAQVGADLTIAWSPNGIFRISTGSGSDSTVQRITYTATGAEGTDFFVPIPVTTASDDYEVIPANKGAGSAGAVVPDLPDALGTDRKTTEFRVLVHDTLSAGSKIAFLLVE